MTSLFNDNENIACESCGKVIMREMSFNSIKLFTVTINGKHWTRAKEICQSLKYHRETGHVIRDHCSCENIRHKYELVGLADTSVQWPKNSQKYDIYINEEGMHELVLKSTMSNATDFAKQLGINIVDNKIISKEAETLSCKLKAFKGENMKEQYTVDGYRIDLYFPTHKLAIECDEFGHKDRDIGYEVTRQKYIETKLVCTFIRYNPDAKDFDIFIVINSIMKYILCKQ